MNTYNFWINNLNFNWEQIVFDNEKGILHEIISQYTSPEMSDKIRIDVLLGKNWSWKTRLLTDIYETNTVAYENTDELENWPLKDDAFKFWSKFWQSSLSKFETMWNWFMYILYTLLHKNDILKSSLSNFFDEENRKIDDFQLLFATSKDFCVNNIYFFDVEESHEQLDSRVHYVNKEIFKNIYEDWSKDISSIFRFFEALKDEIENRSGEDSIFKWLGAEKARQFFLSNTWLLFATINQTKINMKDFTIWDRVWDYLKKENEIPIRILIQWLKLYMYWMDTYMYWIDSIEDNQIRNDYTSFYVDSIIDRFSNSWDNASSILNLLNACLELVNVQERDVREKQVKEIENQFFQELNGLWYKNLFWLFTHLTTYEKWRFNKESQEFFILDLWMSFKNKNLDPSDFYIMFWHFIGRVERDNSNLLCSNDSSLWFLNLYEIHKVSTPMIWSKGIYSLLQIIDVEKRWDKLLTLDFQIDLSDWSTEIYSNLSAWQQMMIFRFTSVYHDLIEKKEKYNINSFVILIDEPWLHMHPERQKTYIQKLLDLYTPVIEELDIKIHFIIATHSPYIVSDIPINNIVFLEDWTDVSDRYRLEDKQTFANTTYNIVSDFLGANDTMWALTKEILWAYVDEMKRLLWKLYTAESDEVDTTEIQSEIHAHKEKYKIILDNIWDPYLKEHLLHIY